MKSLDAYAKGLKYLMRTFYAFMSIQKRPKIFIEKNVLESQLLEPKSWYKYQFGAVFFLNSVLCILVAQ